MRIPVFLLALVGVGLPAAGCVVDGEASADLESDYLADPVPNCSIDFRGRPYLKEWTGSGSDTAVAGNVFFTCVASKNAAYEIKLVLWERVGSRWETKAVRVPVPDDPWEDWDDYWHPPFTDLEVRTNEPCDTDQSHPFRLSASIYNNDTDRREVRWSDSIWLPCHVE